MKALMAEAPQDRSKSRADPDLLPSSLLSLLALASGYRDDLAQEMRLNVCIGYT
jgi:hypothetical protein